VCIAAPGEAAVWVGTNYTVYRAGEGLRVTGHADALPDAFDAWAVVLAPGGEMYFMSLAGTPAPGPFPLALAVPGLPVAMDATLLSVDIPWGLARGEYQAVLALLPAGTAVTSVAEAEAKAIDGCFARARFYLASGLVSIVIDGTWNVTLDGLGSGTMTIERYTDNFIVEGTFSGKDGLEDASILGFIELDTFTLFLNFPSTPGTQDLILKGGLVDGMLSGTWVSDKVSPFEGGWTAARDTPPAAGSPAGAMDDDAGVP
jgi:hypothetical protein